MSYIAGKIWFSVSEDQTHLFLDLLSELYDKSVEGCSKGVIDIKCPAMFRHKMMWINPFLVIARGIRVHVCVLHFSLARFASIMIFTLFFR